MAKGPCVLIVLDGWGIAPPGPGNAIHLAHTPNLDRYWRECPHSTLAASGPAVGLPEGQIGNSEVGHLNLGAGYRVLQELPRIDAAIASGAFFENKALCNAIDTARDGGHTLHLLGLFSYGGVHSHASHLYALLDLCARRGLQRVSVHPFLDGRDTAQRQALVDLPHLESKLAGTGVGRIATARGACANLVVGSSERSMVAVARSRATQGGLRCRPTGLCCETSIRQSRRRGGRSRRAGGSL